MATFDEHDNDLKTCPYDSTHRMKTSRFQLHVAKCEKNHLNAHLSTCPFNAQHRPCSGEFNHHLLNCDCRGVIDRQLIADSTESTYRGHVGVPPYYSEPIESNENWDNEISVTSGYVPGTEPPSGGIRTDFAGMKPSQRKKYYSALHQRDDEKSNEQSEKNESFKNSTAQDLRKPKTVSYAQLLDERRPDLEFPNIGLGRGQPVASSSSRIAANIFGQQPTQMRQPKSTPQIPGFQISSLGMGRGNRAVNVDDGLTKLRQETEAISVGHGRGKI